MEQQTDERMLSYLGLSLCMKVDAADEHAKTSPAQYSLKDVWEWRKQ